MDEQQMIQILNQIPLDVLQNYVAQRTQQEQGAAMEQMPAEMPMSPQPTMAYGGSIRNWSPYVDLYACGGSTRSIARGRLGARSHKR